MTRKEISTRAAQRYAEFARERHVRLERERVEREEAAERASGRRRPNVLEMAAARTRATHELEEAERFYVSAGVAQFEALLAEDAAHDERIRNCLDRCQAASDAGLERAERLWREQQGLG